MISNFKCFVNKEEVEQRFRAVLESIFMFLTFFFFRQTCYDRKISLSAKNKFNKQLTYRQSKVELFFKLISNTRSNVQRTNIILNGLFLPRLRSFKENIPCTHIKNSNLKSQV